MTQVALVTGTSSGMGLHTAVGLAGKGVRVVATMRDTTNAAALRSAAPAAGAGFDVRTLDVTDPASLDQLAAQARELSDRTPEGQYTHSGLEAADALRDQTMAAVQNVAATEVMMASTMSRSTTRMATSASQAPGRMTNSGSMNSASGSPSQ